MTAGLARTPVAEAARPGTALSARASAPGPALLTQLAKLDALLKAAVDRARFLSAADERDWSFHGLYISENEIDSLIERANCETLAADGAVAQVAADFLASTHLDSLRGRWHFTDFDSGVLMLALAPEIDLRYERIYAYLQDDVTKRRPTVDLALNLLCTSAQARFEQRDRFAPEAPLVRSGMLRLAADPSVVEPPLLAKQLRLDERAIRALLGEDMLDSRLAGFCAYVAEPAEPDGQRDTALRLATYAARARQAGRALRLLFSGPTTASKRQVAGELAKEDGRRLLAAELDRYPEWRTEPANIAALLMREAVLSDAMLYIDGFKPGAAEEEATKSVLAGLADHPGGVIVASDAASVAAIAGHDRFLDIAFDLPDHDTRRALWQRLTAQAGIRVDDPTLVTLTNNFVLAPDQIATAVNVARHRLDWRSTVSGEVATQEAGDEVLAAARAQTGMELAALTVKIHPIYRWNDIVLAEDSLTQLKEICARVRFGHDVLETGGFGKKLSTGKGIAALFVGPSGTGKSMAAEVIANELSLDLFRIDLSQVVSKYIGETEQNLDRIFNAALRSNGVLLFDEADSLMGKRSPVHDAHDRYANIEISYLLQKMEQHEGITILTTNLRGNIDEAFLRRLTFCVQFPFPDEPARLEIWKRLWPSETTVDPDVDLAALAKRFRLSGGNITNIGLSAAFLAGAESRPVRMADILRATQREYAKVGKHLTAAELENVVQ